MAISGVGAVRPILRPVCIDLSRLLSGCGGAFLLCCSIRALGRDKRKSLRMTVVVQFELGVVTKIVSNPEFIAINCTPNMPPICQLLKLTNIQLVGYK
jgi:hypothetical protein